MERVYSIEEQKVAEKLTILNSRCIGMLTQLYNVKKDIIVFRQGICENFNILACGDSNSRPKYFTEKNYEPLISRIQKKFPNVDMSKDKIISQLLKDCYQDVSSTLHYYYQTFVDILDFVDSTREVLTSLNVGGIFCDLNLKSALLSLTEIYRGKFAVKETVNGLIGIISRPMRIKNVAKTPKMRSDLLLRNVMNEWIIIMVFILVGFLLHQLQFTENESHDLWKEALQDCFCFPLYRDEVVIVQRLYEIPYIQNNKVLSKRLKEVTDYTAFAVTQSGVKHKEIRNILKLSLNELRLIFTDQPGLLGPKIISEFLLLLIGSCCYGVAVLNKK
ncbi:uncharacterized protein TRIADDRAFT_51856 [Trichoplax adhaerens]|uniref:Uncharacterized protein n=1 Tax=Trichoplax adhaerens TaxID=10228 RepID=B3RL28_TRIAD|nr:hypothetical protein TRIADDRAFT_51856 [Trichoplax adhaerens]EDV28688.1 hypothetical protein TRIADDRAFT_51856 [Trichoplax adhaerens]|eukprot:XP_002107890.1 hypothetical protein TRIADDRAFT_51856 [Trichoplax adhaerens]